MFRLTFCAMDGGERALALVSEDWIRSTPISAASMGMKLSSSVQSAKNDWSRLGIAMALPYKRTAACNGAGRLVPSDARSDAMPLCCSVKDSVLGRDATTLGSSHPMSVRFSCAQPVACPWSVSRGQSAKATPGRALVLRCVQTALKHLRSMVSSRRYWVGTLLQMQPCKTSRLVV